jgi:hypothetical protein
MKVVATNWVNILGVFFVLLLYSTIINFKNNSLEYNFFQSIVAGFILVCFHGFMFWGLFIFSLIILDLSLLTKEQGNLKKILLLEWVIVSSPFIFWTIKYQECIFLIGVLTFLITQFMRKKYILENYLSK